MELTTIGILVGALHFNPAVDGPARLTPGIYAQASNGAVGAIYRNCTGRVSLMAGYAVPLPLDASLHVGLVSGYRNLKRPIYVGISAPIGERVRLMATPRALALGIDF